MLRRNFLTVALLSTVAVAPSALAQSLRGSPHSLDRQNSAAQAHDYTYLQSRRHVMQFVQSGYLVPLRGNENYEIARFVSYPYARRETLLFVERLAAQYRNHCGEKLVVTSVTRPKNEQPANASDRSVHPTGMAIDLRISHNRKCVRWIEATLLELENRDLIEATRERRPPHYHVVVFSQPYRRYASALGASPRETARTASTPGQTTKNSRIKEASSKKPSTVRHKVRKGESLWTIARRYKVSIEAIQEENRLKGAKIKVGQTLKIPQS